MFNRKKKEEQNDEMELQVTQPDVFEFPADMEKPDTGNDELNEKISELSKMGYQYLKEGETEKAKGQFNEILQLEENNNYALVGLGDAERKSNNFDAAIFFYEKCLNYHPSNNYALFGLADCYKAMNKYTKAIEIWEKYLRQDDRNITVLTRVADAYRKIHIFKRSKDIYLRVLEMEDTNPYALIGLGHLHYDYKEYKDALHYWTKMYELDKDSCDIRVLTSIGNCHRKLKTYSDGVFYFEKALERDPHNFYALFGMADCYRGMNQQFRSIEYWNKILEMDPNNKVILTRIGDAYRNTGDYQQAEKCYTEALNIDFDVYAALGLALIRKGEGRYEEAAERLQDLIRNDRKNYRLYIDLADCYCRIGRKQDAIKLLEGYLTFGLKSPAILDALNKIKFDRPLYS